MNTNLVSVMEDSVYNRDDVSVRREMLQSKYAFQLLKADQCRRASHEPSYCRVRQKIHQYP